MSSNNLRKPEMIKDLFGKRFHADHETKIWSEISAHNVNSIAILHTSTIKGRETTEPLRTLKDFNVSPSVFVETINSEFKEHNLRVDEYFNNLRLNTIDVIKAYCGAWSIEKRKTHVETAYQKDIYQIETNGSVIRFMPGRIYFFENGIMFNDAIYTIGNSDKNTPVLFTLDQSEFKELAEMFLNF